MTDLQAVQTGSDTVLVNWTAPSPAPPRGYQISLAPNNTNTTVMTSHTLTITEPGNYTIQVEPLSMHFPSEAVSAQVTVVEGNIPIASHRMH